MGWGRIALLYAIAGILAGLYFRGGVLLPGPAAAGRTGARPSLVGMGPDAVRSLRLSRGTRLLVVERTGQGWAVREPAEAPIPAGLIDAFVEALTNTRTIAPAGDANGDLTPFGLGEQADRIEVRSDAPAPVVVLLGSTNPTGTSVYAHRVGDPQVEVVGRNVAYYADLLFQALPPAQVPAEIQGPVGG